MLPDLAALYVAGSKVAHALPDGFATAAMAVGGAAWFQLSRGQRAAALQNYAAVLRLPPGHPDVQRTARRAFQNYGRTLFDFTRLASMTRAEVGERVTVAGEHHIDRALERGRGAVLALAHMGSWDLAGAYAGSVLGYDVYAAAEPFPGSLGEAVLKGREHFGLKVVPVDRRLVRRAGEILGRNGVFCLLTDVPHGGTVEVTMFEHRVALGVGPAALAQRSGAGLLVVLMWSTGPGRYHLQVEPELTYETSGDRRQQVAELTQRVAQILERGIRAHPDQWFAFRPLVRPAAA